MITTRLPVCIAIILTGCALRVVTSGQEQSPDGKLRAAVVVRTAPGVAYTSMGEKQVNIAITTGPSGGGQTLFAKEYHLRAAHLEWSIVWRDANRCEIDLYSYDPGVFPPGVETVRNRSRADRQGTIPIRTVILVGTASSGFREEM